MAQKVSAPRMERMQPATLIRSLLNHPDDLFVVVVQRNPQVLGAPEIVIGTVAHPGCQGIRRSALFYRAGQSADNPVGDGEPLFFGTI